MAFTDSSWPDLTKRTSTLPEMAKGLDIVISSDAPSTYLVIDSSISAWLRGPRPGFVRVSLSLISVMPLRSPQ